MTKTAFGIRVPRSSCCSSGAGITRILFVVLGWLVLQLAGAAAFAQSADRGHLLYTTHCVECHTTRMHWREQRLARDMPSLRAQVARWQAAANLQWSESDIEAVAQHLNSTIYRFPVTQARKAPAPGR
jgi:cytochrome c553